MSVAPAAVAYLAAMVGAGYGMTLLGPEMEVEERLFFGTVIGAMAATLAGFVAAVGFGFGAGSVLAGLGVALGVAGAGFARGRSRLRPEWADAIRRWKAPGRPGHPWPLAALLAVSWAFALDFLHQALVLGPRGLVAGYVNVWGDWSAHLTYAGSFAFGHNLPPRFPIDSGHHLAYPFLVDFMTASLVPLGSSLISALLWSEGLLALALPGVFYLAARRMLGGRAAPFLAVGVFALSGGLGFGYWFGDLVQRGPSALAHIPRQYTADATLNYQWLNPVLAYLVPQRDILFGLPVVLIAASLLWTARDRSGALLRPGASAHLFTGLLVGITPLFHVHAYGTCVALFAFWALIERRRRWIWFFVPALGLGIPALAWLLPGLQPAIRWQVGWLAGSGGHSGNWLWFWIENTGLLIPLLVAGTLWRGVVERGLQLRLAPIWLWFLVPNLAVFQPWDWDNTKYFVFWLLLGSLLVAAVLVRLFRRGKAGAALAAVCCVVLGLAGTLDLARSLDRRASAILLIDPPGLRLAAWVRGHTPPRAIFLTAPVHDQPVPVLAGRTVVLGYPGWVWSYGLGDLGPRTAAVERMLRGGPDTPRLLRAYRVGYVVIGPSEIREEGASPAYWDSHADRVYSNGEYTVYRVPGRLPPPG